MYTCVLNQFISRFTQVGLPMQLDAFSNMGARAGEC